MVWCCSVWIIFYSLVTRQLTWSRYTGCGRWVESPSCRPTIAPVRHVGRGRPADTSDTPTVIMPDPTDPAFLPRININRSVSPSLTTPLSSYQVDLGISREYEFEHISDSWPHIHNPIKNRTFPGVAFSNQSLRLSWEIRETSQCW